MSRGSRPSAGELANRRLPLSPGAGFVPLPLPAGQPPYRLELAEVIGAGRSAAIADAGALRFHCVGDTGGEGDPAPQRAVAAAMIAELGGPSPVGFFYHLGDVVYPHGERANYEEQFHAPYAGYDAPIFAIPGNHDAEGADGLEPFLDVFGAPAPADDGAAAPARPPSRQPHVFWTLVHEWVRIVGLYGNVPEGGQLGDEQVRWLVGELAATPPETTLILAVHQPLVSADVVHGSNLCLLDLLDECAEEAGRAPDAVLCGHAHVYQRFSRRRDGRETPYVVCGAGGFPLLHPLGSGVGPLPARFAGLEGITLDAYEDRAHGFLTVTVRPGGAEVAYNALSAGAVACCDRFRIEAPGVGIRKCANVY
ncbi:MAG TPA: metallophosphoesterase [Solirubrobacterales bacterium]|jgi:hypothetical protein